MRRVSSMCLGTAMAAFMMGSAGMLAQQTDPSPAPDNTAVNGRDRQSGAQTAQSQSNSKKDTEVTRKIRRELTKDSSLSMYAHNVKIITQDGQVTLKGPVNSEQEKQAIVAKAAAVAGQGNVKDELEVKGSAAAPQEQP